MMISIIRGSVFTITLALSAGIALATPQPAITPWPPVTQDRYAPQNWPVPHPAPPVNLDKIPAGIVYRGLTLKERKAVQSSLAAVGYYSEPIDGVWGPATWNATVSYAERVGIKVFLNDMSGALRVFQHITN